MSDETEGLCCLDIIFRLNSTSRKSTLKISQRNRFSLVLQPSLIGLNVNAVIHELVFQE